MQFSAIENGVGDPYLHYNPEGADKNGVGGGRENDGSDGNRKKDKSKRGSRKDRPSTARRKKDKHRDGDKAEAKEVYPSSKGRERVEYK